MKAAEEIPEGVEHIPAEDQETCETCGVDQGSAKCKQCKEIFCWGCFAEHACVRAYSQIPDYKKAMYKKYHSSAQEHIEWINLMEDYEDRQLFRVQALTEALFVSTEDKSKKLVTDLGRNEARPSLASIILRTFCSSGGSREEVRSMAEHARGGFRMQDDDDYG